MEQFEECELHVQGIGDIMMNMEQQRIELTYKYWVNLVNTPEPSTVLREFARTPEFPVLFPEIHALNNVLQGAYYHPEGDVFEHSMQAMDVAQKVSAHLPEEDRVIIVLSALCHDFGKVTHTQFHDDGRITSQNHAMAGVEPAGLFLRRINAPEFIVTSVQTLVMHHMVHTTAFSPSMVRRLRKVLHSAGLTVKHLALVIDSDTGGRSSASKSGVGDELLRVEATVIAHDNRHKMNRINGDFLIGLGFQPGEIFREIIVEYNKARIDLSDDEMKEWVLSRFPVNQ